MDFEQVRLTALALFLIWMQVGTRHVLGLANGRPGNVAARSVTYGGAVLQTLVCLGAVIAFPGVTCFIAALVNVGAMIGIAYATCGRRQGHRASKQRVVRHLPGWMLYVLRRHGILVCAMAGAGAGFLIYAAPLL